MGIYRDEGNIALQIKSILQDKECCVVSVNDLVAVWTNGASSINESTLTMKLITFSKKYGFDYVVGLQPRTSKYEYIKFWFVPKVKLLN